MHTNLSLRGRPVSCTRSESKNRHSSCGIRRKSADRRFGLSTELVQPANHEAIALGTAEPLARNRSELPPRIPFPLEFHGAAIGNPSGIPNPNAVYLSRIRGPLLAPQVPTSNVVSSGLFPLRRSVSARRPIIMSPKIYSPILSSNDIFQKLGQSKQIITGTDLTVVLREKEHKFVGDLPPELKRIPNFVFRIDKAVEALQAINLLGSESQAFKSKYPCNASDKLDFSKFRSMGEGEYGEVYKIIIDGKPYGLKIFSSTRNHSGHGAWNETATLLSCNHAGVSDVIKLYCANLAHNGWQLREYVPAESEGQRIESPSTGPGFLAFLRANGWDMFDGIQIMNGVWFDIGGAAPRSS